LIRARPRIGTSEGKACAATGERLGFNLDRFLEHGEDAEGHFRKGVELLRA
jgi:hypothetical protein